MEWLKNKVLGLFVKTNGVLSKPILGGLGHIFMLHRVLPTEQRDHFTINKDLAITPEYLIEVIHFFKEKKYQFLSMDELHSLLIQGKKTKQRFVIFTLDDGYRDNITYGLPVFEEFNIPITIYVTNSFPNQTSLQWWYLLESYMEKNHALTFKSHSEIKNYRWLNETEKLTVFTDLTAYIRSLSKEASRQFLQNDLNFSSEEISKIATENALNWDELAQASKHPLITIGAHTMNHLSLQHLTEKEVIEEVQNAREEMQIQLSSPIDHFAYPYGGFSDAYSREYKLVKSLGFKTAVINYPGAIFNKNANFLECLPRMSLGNSTSKEKLENMTNGIHHFGFNGFHKHVHY